MRVDLHARILTRDGEHAGNIEHAIVDPRTNQVTDFIVSAGGLFGKDVIVSHSDIEHASDDGQTVQLRLEKGELQNLPTYDPVDYTPPPPDWLPPRDYGFPLSGFAWPARLVDEAAHEPWEAPRAVVIDRGSSVIDSHDRDVGVVEDVRLAADGEHLEGFDVRLGGALRTLAPGGDVVHVGADLIDSVEPRLVRLRVEKDALKS